MKFSIVSPSFNQLDWLRLCVASTEDQEGVDVDHIIQDAGTDGVAEITRRRGDATAERKDYALRLFEEKDEGMYDAINRGLARATGEICSWLNCDEQYLPGSLKTVARFFADHPTADVLFGDAILVNAEGVALSYRRAVLPTRIHTRLVHLNTLSCATFFRHSIVERGMLFDAKWKSIGDAVWIHRLLEAGVRMAVMPEPLAVFTFTGANLSEANKGPGSEQDRWRRGPDAPPTWLAKPVSSLHRARKFWAGAYRERDLSYEIFTRASPNRRLQFDSVDLGYGWPST